VRRLWVPTNRPVCLLAPPASSRCVPPAAVNQQAGTVPIPGKIGLIDSGVDVAHPVFEAFLFASTAARRGRARAHGTAVASLMIAALLISAVPIPAPSSMPPMCTVVCLRAGRPMQWRMRFRGRARARASDQRKSGGSTQFDTRSGSTFGCRPRSPRCRRCRQRRARSTSAVSASYPGVVGVTAVDTHRRVLFEAGGGRR